MAFAGHNRGKYLEPNVGYVRGQKATSIFLEALGKSHKCPFCRHLNHTENNIKLCGGCGRRWFKNRCGDFIYVGYYGEKISNGGNNG